MYRIRCGVIAVFMFTSLCALANSVVPANRFDLSDEVVITNMYQSITNGNGVAAYKLFLYHSITRNDDAEASLWLWIAKSLGDEAARSTVKAACASGDQLTVESVFSRARVRENSCLKIDKIMNGIIRYGRNMVANDMEAGRKEKDRLLYYGCPVELLNGLLED